MQILGGSLDKLRTGSYRAGPWPGLTLRGALVILLHAALLALIAETWAPLSPVPLVLATWVMRMPGVATAVCGAYLLPRSLLSLATGAALPPLLLAPAMAFDLAVWVRRADLPRWPNKWRKRERRPRKLETWRVALAVLISEVVLALAG